MSRWFNDLKQKTIDELKQEVEKYRDLFEREGLNNYYLQKRYDSLLDEKMKLEVKNAELSRDIHDLKLKNEIYEKFLSTVNVNVEFPKDEKKGTDI